MKTNYENSHRKSPKPLWFQTFLPLISNRFALLVAEAGFEPTTSRVAVTKFATKLQHRWAQAHNRLCEA